MGYSNKKLRSKSKSRLRSRSTLRSKRNKKTKGGSLPGLEGDTLTLTKEILDSNPNFKKREYMFVREIKADESVTEIPPKLFRDLSSLVTVDFSNAKNLTVIRRYAFYGCVRLEKVILPKVMSVENCPFVIQDGAFRECKRLNEIEFPPTKNIIIPCEDTFLGCRKLVTLNFKVLPNQFFVKKKLYMDESETPEIMEDKGINSSLVINRNRLSRQINGTKSVDLRKLNMNVNGFQDLSLNCINAPELNNFEQKFCQNRLN